MSGDSISKINKLLKKWPQGTVATADWLEKQNIYQQLAFKYAKSAWLESLGGGAFLRSGDKVEWTGALYAIQKHLKLPIHVGGKTALALHGISQFVPLGKGQRIYLLGEPTTKLPTWFKKKDWGVSAELIRSKFLPVHANLGITEIVQGAFSIRVASRERAMLEVCQLVPKQQDYAEARFLMESLQTLRPSLVQSLLEQCKSIKAKRLFLHLAEACNLPWVERINTSKIGLGSGKRSLAKGGVFDAKYNLVVPRLEEGSADGI